MPRRFIDGSTPILLGSAMRGVRRHGYGRDDARADLLAGLITGVVALPLSMALAIAAGAPPQHGLFTAIVAGIVIALAGGSMHSVSGPTAAFVVLLAPVTAEYGFAGLAVASLMAGVIMLMMGLAKLGKLIQFIPYPVTTGFTAGIGVVIAFLQLGDVLGVGPISGDHLWDRLAALGARMGDVRWPEVTLALVTIGIIIGLPRVTKRIPSPLVALVVAAVLGVVLAASGQEVVTIETRFGGIPAVPPLPTFPWSGGDIDLTVVRALLGPALAIALLGAIESLLCAVVADGMTGARHDSDAELVGLGLGNIVAPFFGGFAATGAIARSATAIRAGARTPLAVVFHSVFILVAMLALAPLLGALPMAAMGGLLLVVAWNMSDVGHFVRILRTAPRSDVMVLLVCFGLTVAFDMVVAVGVGVVLAAFLFMRRMIEISGATLVGAQHPQAAGLIEPGTVHYEIAGPLFFGAAQKALEALTTVDHTVDTVIIDLGDVPAIDATGLVALESALEHLHRSNIVVRIVDVRPQPRRALTKAGIVDSAVLTVVEA
jgi:sulfate permease, SulP family